MNEATLRDVLYGIVPAARLAAEIGAAIEAPGKARRRIHIQDLPGDERVTVTAPMLVRLCDAVLAGALPGEALEPIAFALIVSDHLSWNENDEMVGRVLYDWAAPDIAWELTPEIVRMFRDWLTGEAQAPSEPEVSTDTLREQGFLKVRARPS